MLWPLRRRIIQDQPKARVPLLKFWLCLSLGFTASAPLAFSQDIDPAKWARHPSILSEDPAAFRDIGDSAKSDRVFFDGRRSIALTERSDMSIVRLKNSAKGTALAEKQVVKSGPASLQGSFNHGWCRVIDAYFIGDLGNSKALKTDPEIQTTFPVYNAGATVWGLNDRICIRFLPGTPVGLIEDLLNHHGLTIESRPEEIGVSDAYDVRSVGAQGDQALRISNTLAEHATVDYSSPDWITLTKKNFIPNDPRFRDQWHLDSSSTVDAVEGSDINAPAAWDRTLGAGVRVLVLDDGMDYDHEDLRIATDSTGAQIGLDPVGGDNDPRPSGDDSHGTSVGGVIAAIGNNGRGVTGVAPAAELIGVRIIGFAVPDSSFRNAFLFGLQHNADLCNNSWGYVTFTDPCIDSDDVEAIPISPILRDGLEQLIYNGRGGLGCVTLFAAGNDRVNIQFHELNGHPDVVSVAASNNVARRSWYSSYGPPIDVCAPSNDFNPVLSGVPCQQIWTGGTLGITTTDQMGRRGSDSTNYTDDFGGTSSACPTTCGLAALILSANPFQTRQQIVQVMTSTAEKIDPAGGQYNSSGFSIYYGFGRIDAAAALARFGTPTPTFTPSRTPTNTPTPTHTFTPTPTPTPTNTNTPRFEIAVNQHSTLPNPVYVATGDLNGDGFDEIVTAHYSEGQIGILTNDGAGAFPGPAVSLNTGEGFKPTHVAIGDLDNDSDNDLIVTVLDSDRILVFLNNGNGAFPAPPRNLNLAVHRPLSVFLGHLNGDDFYDLAVANSEQDTLTLALSQSSATDLLNGNFLTRHVSTGGQLPTYIKGERLDRNSPDPALRDSVDLVIPNFESQTVTVLLGAGDGTFLSPIQSIDTDVNPRQVSLEDMDNNGALDIVVACEGAPQRTPPYPGSVEVYYNNVLGQFGNRARYVLGQGPVDIVGFDFDSDNDRDVAVALEGLPAPHASPPVPGAFSTFFNDGAVLDYYDTYPAIGDRPLSLAVGSLTDSVRNDLVMANQQGGGVGIVRVTSRPKVDRNADIDRSGAQDFADLFRLSVLYAKRDPSFRRLADLDGDDLLGSGDILSFLRSKRLAASNDSSSSPNQKAEKVPAAPKVDGAGDRNGDGATDYRDVIRGFEG